MNALLLSSALTLEAPIMSRIGQCVVHVSTLGLVLCASMLFQVSLPAQDWQVTMAGIWGDQGKQEFQAVAVDESGIAYVGVTPHRTLAGVPDHDFANGRGGGGMLAIDTALGEVLWTARLPGPAQSFVIGIDDHLLMLAGGVIKVHLPTQAVVWHAGGGGRRILCDGAGGAWTFDGRTAIQLNDQGQQQRSVSISGRDFAVDPKGERLFTCGHNSGRSTIKDRNPVHVPWVRAFNFEGERLWQMYGFTPTQVDEVGDMADSHPQRLFFSANGHLYMFGDSDGGNTPYRHSPHTPGGALDGQLRGTPFNQTWRAFRSVRMLFVCRINPSNGDVLRGTFFYGMWFNEERNRQEIGDSQALGLYVDNRDRVYLTGIMRTGIPFTTNAVHKQSAPTDRQGYWRNQVATDEAYVAIIDQDFTRLAFCSGFNQNGSPRAWSRGLGIAAGGNGMAMVGTVRPNADYAVTDLNFQRSALQEKWGGEQDGYIAVLHHGILERDPQRHVQSTLTALFPNTDDPHVRALYDASNYPKVLETFATAEDPAVSSLDALMGRLGAQLLSRAQSFIAMDPWVAQRGYQGIARLWKGASIAEQAELQLTAMREDPTLRQALVVGESKAEAMSILSGLQDAPRAERASLLDREYARRNGRVLQRFQQAAMRMHQQWPEHQFTKEIIEVASNYAVPVTPKDQEMVGYYGEVMMLQQRMRPSRSGPSHYDNQHFRELNKAIFDEMKSILRTMRRAERRHVFTSGVEDVLAGWGVPID